MVADRVGVLNGGRLEQLGCPEEIYHRPGTRASWLVSWAKRTFCQAAS